MFVFILVKATSPAFKISLLFIFKSLFNISIVFVTEFNRMLSPPPFLIVKSPPSPTTEDTPTIVLLVISMSFDDVIIVGSNLIISFVSCCIDA